MKDLGFGLILTLMGMGTTMVTLWMITLIIKVLDRIFPYGEEQESKK